MPIDIHIARLLGVVKVEGVQGSFTIGTLVLDRMKRAGGGWGT